MKRIVVLPGDGIGPEIMEPTTDLLGIVLASSGIEFELEFCDFGGVAIDQFGVALPQRTLDACLNSDAVLLGAVGGPRWVGRTETPEKGLLALRKALGVFANLRPIVCFPEATSFSPLKSSIIHNVDMVIVRELTGGIYFGEKRSGSEWASDLCEYHQHEIERVARVAGDLATKRRGRILSVDKANVLETSRLWRKTVSETIREHYPKIELEHMYVDAAAMYLLREPSEICVLVTENLFGDILSDEASMLCGSLGLLGSASLSSDGPGLFEPIHGSAPDIAGQGVANPIGMMLSMAMMLRSGLDLKREAMLVESAVRAVIGRGILTPDLMPDRGYTTRQVAVAVRSELENRINYKTPAQV